MRSFVAASCCLIVGLEILIGVPVAVCLGFLCFGSEFSGTYVAESQYQPPIYAPVPYSPSSLSTGKPLATFDPYVCPPPLPACCPAPVAAQSGDCKELQPPPPNVKVVAANDALVQPAANSAAPIGDAQQFVARVFSEENCPQSTANGEPAALTALATSIRQTTHLLYRHAERCEEAGDFSEADGIRSLARDLRQEVERLTHSTEGAPLLSEAPVNVLPSGVTVGPPPRG
jgi:hypothetical protein